MTKLVQTREKEKKVWHPLTWFGNIFEIKWIANFFLLKGFQWNRKWTLSIFVWFDSIQLNALFIIAIIEIHSIDYINEHSIKFDLKS